MSVALKHAVFHWRNHVECLTPKTLVQSSHLGILVPKNALVCLRRDPVIFYIFCRGGGLKKTKCAMKEKELAAKQTLELCALGCFKLHWRKSLLSAADTRARGSDVTSRDEEMSAN